MLSAGVWELSQQNTILFVLVDSSGNEVAGLGSGYTLEISKNGDVFASSAGTKSEIGSGWYKYVSTAGEADTVGPVAVKVTHASTIQQNLEYIVLQRTASSIAFTYTITDSSTTNPIEGVYVRITTDSSGNNNVWAGYTDAFGVARDTNDNLPRLDPGTYYLWRQKSGYAFNDPDQEVVS